IRRRVGKEVDDFIKSLQNTKLKKTSPPTNLQNFKIKDRVNAVEQSYYTSKHLRPSDEFTSSEFEDLSSPHIASNILETPIVKNYEELGNTSDLAEDEDANIFQNKFSSEKMKFS
ncbi:unnamed protein product, partial [Allacma fusca]